MGRYKFVPVLILNIFKRNGWACHIHFQHRENLEYNQQSEGKFEERMSLFASPLASLIPVCFGR